MILVLTFSVSIIMDDCFEDAWAEDPVLDTEIGKYVVRFPKRTKAENKYPRNAQMINSHRILVIKRLSYTVMIFASWLDDLFTADWHQTWVCQL